MPTAPSTAPVPFWSLPAERALSELKTSNHGLTTEEAARRLTTYGKNIIDGRRRLGALTILLSQLKSPLIIILLIGGGISLALNEWVNAAVILATVIVNTGLGFWQENKAETVLEELKTYLKTGVRVRRNGTERKLDASELVPGDIIHVSQGDRVPADGRILEAKSLDIDESVLTGESLPVHKEDKIVKEEAPLGERDSMVWSGTLVAQGYAEVVVTGTGAQTEFGRIAEMVSSRERETTPLQKAVASFARVIAVVVIALSGLLFGIGFALGQDPTEMFFISVAIAVSAVPEGLPVALTVILAIGVERLARQKGIVRKLLAAETLGSTSLILTDKTGTLTQADMRLVDVVAHGGDTEEHQAVLLREAVLNADLVIENPDEDPEEWKIIGRSMESSLVRDAGKRGILLPRLLKTYRILDRLPFDSKKKYGTALVEDGDRRVILMGAPEILLGLADLPAEERKALEREMEERAYGGERLLGVASTAYARERLDVGASYERLEFKGFLAFRDPLRPNVKEAVKRIAQADVRTVIVTGDHKGTAEHVARELGILEGRGLVMTGAELAAMDPARLRERLPDIRVYARVTPEQKLMLVRLYRERGEIVAVTGDGVNDAPALQAADVGVAVGSGTEVAKGAADLVILDDNFNTIVIAIEEGRRILDNIRKTVVYLLSDAVDELALIGGALLFQVPIPITALQILYVNFFSDSFPAIALAFEEIRDSKHRVRTSGTSVIFNAEVRFMISVLGLGTSALLFVIYYWLLSQGHDPTLVRTFIFASFATYTLFVAFSLRALRRGIFTYNPFGNRYLTTGVGIGLGLTAAAVYLPFLQTVLGTVALPLPWLGGVLVVGLVNIAFAESAKWMYRKRED
ncbi:MAG: HAD-IC family P-type ATPase [Candidatus Uhrbacteria bacterium]|nr:HAD-IC family P-type ATPase [Candidatus Uhrbacteria bacterium]